MSGGSSPLRSSVTLKAFKNIRPRNYRVTTALPRWPYKQTNFLNAVHTDFLPDVDIAQYLRQSESRQKIPPCSCTASIAECTQPQRRLWGNETVVSLLLRWWVSTGELTISRRRIATDIEILSLHKIYMHHILHSRDTSSDLTSLVSEHNFLYLRVDRRQDSGRRGVNRLSQFTPSLLCSCLLKQLSVVSYIKPGTVF